MPESWIGKRVTVEVRTRRGESYLVLGRLHGATHERLTLDPSGSQRLKYYPWESVVDVRLPEDA
jgi:hypothetical protein